MGGGGFGGCLIGGKDDLWGHKDEEKWQRDEKHRDLTDRRDGGSDRSAPVTWEVGKMGHFSTFDPPPSSDFKIRSGNAAMSNY